jgi:hypothetical protein
MQLTLPDTLVPWAERKAARQGYGSLAEYVTDLLARERAQDDPDLFIRDAIAADSGVAPEDVAGDIVERRKGEIEQKLLEALASGPATPMTKDDWDALRQLVQSTPSANG